MRNPSALRNWLALMVIVTLISGCSLFRKNDKVDENATVEQLYVLAKQSIEKEVI